MIITFFCYLGARQEQDIFVRLIDSQTKQVSALMKSIFFKSNKWVEWRWHDSFCWFCDWSANFWLSQNIQLKFMRSKMFSKFCEKIFRAWFFIFHTLFLYCVAWHQFRRLKTIKKHMCHLLSNYTLVTLIA